MTQSKIEINTDEKIISDFITHAQSTHNTAISSSVGMTLLLLQSNYFICPQDENETREGYLQRFNHYINTLYELACNELNEHVATMPVEHEKSWNRTQAKMLSQFIINLALTPSDALDDVLLYLPVNDDPSQEYETKTYRFSIKKVFTLVWMALNDSSKFEHNYEGTAQEKEKKAHDDLPIRLESFFTALHNVYSGICNTGIRNELVMILNKSYLEIDLIEDFSATIFSFLREQLLERWSAFFNNPEASPIKKEEFLNWLIESRPPLAEDDMILLELNTLFQQHGVDPRTVKSLVTKACTGLPFACNAQQYPIMAALKIIFSTENESLTAIQSWIKSGDCDFFNNEIHQQVISDFALAYSVQTALENAKHFISLIDDVQLISEINQTRELLDDTASSYQRLINFSSGPMLLSPEDRGCLERLNVHVEKIKSNALNGLISNFFAQWFSPETEDERVFLYRGLLSSWVQDKIRLTDKQIISIMNSNSHEEQASSSSQHTRTAIELQPYEINRIFLCAIITNPSQWSELFKQSFSRILNFIQNNFEQEQTIAVAQLKRDSYPQPLIDQLVYLQQLSAGIEQPLRPESMILLPSAIRTAEDWQTICLLLIQINETSPGIFIDIYKKHQVLIEKVLNTSSLISILRQLSPNTSLIFAQVQLTINSSLIFNGHALKAMLETFPENLNVPKTLEEQVLEVSDENELAVSVEPGDSDEYDSDEYDDSWNDSEEDDAPDEQHDDSDDSRVIFAEKYINLGHFSQLSGVLKALPRASQYPFIEKQLKQNPYLLSNTQQVMLIANVIGSEKFQTLETLAQYLNPTFEKYGMQDFSCLKVHLEKLATREYLRLICANLGVFQAADNWKEAFSFLSPNEQAQCIRFFVYTQESEIVQKFFIEILSLLVVEKRLSCAQAALSIIPSINEFSLLRLLSILRPEESLVIAKQAYTKNHSLMFNELQLKRILMTFPEDLDDLAMPESLRNRRTNFVDNYVNLMHFSQLLGALSEISQKNYNLFIKRQLIKNPYLLSNPKQITIVGNLMEGGPSELETLVKSYNPLYGDDGILDFNNLNAHLQNPTIDHLSLLCANIELFQETDHWQVLRLLSEEERAVCMKFVIYTQPEVYVKKVFIDILALVKYSRSKCIRAALAIIPNLIDDGNNLVRILALLAPRECFEVAHLCITATPNVIQTVEQLAEVLKLLELLEQSLLLQQLKRVNSLPQILTTQDDIEKIRALIKHDLPTSKFFVLNSCYAEPIDRVLTELGKKLDPRPSSSGGPS